MHRYHNPNMFPVVGTVSIYPIGQPDSHERIDSKVRLHQQHLHLHLHLSTNTPPPPPLHLYPCTSTPQVLLESTSLTGPSHVTVAGETGVYPSPYELQPGQWTVRCLPAFSPSASLFSFLTLTLPPRLP